MFKKIITYCLFSFFIANVWAGETDWAAGEAIKDVSFLSTAASSDGKKMVAIKQYGNIYTSTDGGVTWKEQTSSGKKYWQTIAMSADGAKMTAANKNGYIYTSTDAGVTWIERTSSGQRNWRAITMSTDGAKQYALDAPTGYIYASANSGETWLARTGSGQKNWQAIATSGDGAKLVAVEENGFLYRSTNSGYSWTENTTFTVSRNWHSVFSSLDGTKLIATESAGSIFTSSNSGATWIEKFPPGNKGWESIVTATDISKMALIMGNDNIFVTTDTGSTWDELTISGEKSWLNIVLSGDGKKIFASDEADSYIFSLPVEDKNVIKPTAGICLFKSPHFFRKCSLKIAPTVMEDFEKNILCEGLIQDVGTKKEDDTMSRYETIQIAVGMLRTDLLPYTEYAGTYSDIKTTESNHDRIATIQTGIANNILSDNPRLDPDQNVTRIEAYTLMMRSVCLAPETSQVAAWMRVVHQVAYENGITVKPWAQFGWNRIITKKELYTVAFRLADWADQTGGCQRFMCQLKS